MQQAFLTGPEHEPLEREWLARFARAHEMNSPERTAISPQILAALNRRAGLQLRLQQAAEASSVAVTYCGSSLVGSFAKGDGSASR